jgi:hypothetical protein
VNSWPYSWTACIPPKTIHEFFTNKRTPQCMGLWELGVYSGRVFIREFVTPFVHSWMAPIRGRLLFVGGFVTIISSDSLNRIHILGGKNTPVFKFSAPKIE